MKKFIKDLNFNKKGIIHFITVVLGITVTLNVYMLTLIIGTTLASMILFVIFDSVVSYYHPTINDERLVRHNLALGFLSTFTYNLFMLRYPLFSFPRHVIVDILGVFIFGIVIIFFQTVYIFKTIPEENIMEENSANDNVNNEGQ